ncbi:MAG: hypothetical protein M0D53_12790 [Flavobacterium sp. JAD_PAG50586_2]|nr:MAG: hypothetical protein M0D53_12790 [Flavobacterium sp. JAD_PAG50586_2]
MKKITILLLLACATLYATPVSGYFDVYLKNNCSKEIEVTIRADGSSSVSKYKNGDKVKVPVKVGYEVYIDGKLFLKLADSDSGKEINLCK